MAVTNENSDQIDANARDLNATDNYGKLRVQRFDFTQGAAAGDANSSVRLFRLKPGRHRILCALSRVQHSAFGTARLLDMGLTAYTDWQGNAVAADPNALDGAQDVAAAGAYAPSPTIGEADDSVEIRNQNDVFIEVDVAGGTIPAAATINGYLIIVSE